MRSGIFFEDLSPHTSFLHLKSSGARAQPISEIRTSAMFLLLAQN